MKEKQDAELIEVQRLLHTVPKCVKNLSNRSLSDREIATLSLGLNYAIPEKLETASLEMIMGVDKIVNETNDQDVSTQTKDKVKNEVAHAIQSFISKK